MTETELHQVVVEKLQVPDEQLLNELHVELLVQNGMTTIGAGDMTSGGFIVLSLNKSPESGQCEGPGDAERLVWPAEVWRMWDAKWTAVRHLVCDDWKFCERRKDFADDVKL